MKIYIASSWRNEFQHQVVQDLRKDGHEVYDFREDGDGWGCGDHGPGGFGWHEIGGPDWKNWVNDIPTYLTALEHPRAEEGFRRDMDALERSDACVMVHPCGVSASMETGWACGAGKNVYVYVPGLREPDLMVKMAALVTNDFARIRAKLSEQASADTPASATQNITDQLRFLQEIGTPASALTPPERRSGNVDVNLEYAGRATPSPIHKDDLPDTPASALTPHRLREIVGWMKITAVLQRRPDEQLYIYEMIADLCREADRLEGKP